MSDYGTHTTQYEKLSNDELYAMYRGSVFETFTNEQKQDLAQETVNRHAAELGMTGAPKVVLVDLPSTINGQTLNGVIEVNNETAKDNCNFLNTVFHENMHAFQEQVIDGTITNIDDDLAMQYRANGNNIGSVVFQNGTYQMGSHYLRGLSSAECSMVQATERDAMKGAEAKTAEIIQSLTEKYGVEPGFENYEKGIMEKGYLAWETAGIERFENPNFEKDVNQTLLNQYFGEDVFVDEATEAAVKAEMITSYEAVLNNESTTNLVSMEEKGMEAEFETYCTGMMPEGPGEVVDVTMQEVPDFEVEDAPDLGEDLDCDDGIDL